MFIQRDGSCAVVVGMLYNEDGILYEDEEVSVLFAPLDAPRLGEEMARALKRTDVRPKDARGAKLSDWPAYKASGARSVREFENKFIWLMIQGANEANLVYVIEGTPYNDSVLGVTSSVSSFASAAELGGCILRVFEACRDRKL